MLSFVVLSISFVFSYMTRAPRVPRPAGSPDGKGYANRSGEALRPGVVWRLVAFHTGRRLRLAVLIFFYFGVNRLIFIGNFLSFSLLLFQLVTFCSSLL